MEKRWIKALFTSYRRQIVFPSGPVWMFRNRPLLLKNAKDIEFAENNPEKFEFIKGPIVEKKSEKDSDGVKEKFSEEDLNKKSKSELTEIIESMTDDEFPKKKNEMIDFILELQKEFE